MKILSILLFTFILVMAMTGCTIFNSTDVVRPSEERMNVKFENENASKLFNDKFRDKMALRTNTMKNDVSIAGVTFYKEQQKLSDNAFWNDEVRRCNTSGDLVISEKEAKAYSESDPFN